MKQNITHNVLDYTKSMPGTFASLRHHLVKVEHPTFVISAKKAVVLDVFTCLTVCLSVCLSVFAVIPKLMNSSS